jgi:hypothetical protein
MSTPETQKSWNQDDRVHPTKVRENERETERARGRDGGPICHRYMSLSLYQGEPSRLPILATTIATWYDEFAQRS